MEHLTHDGGRSAQIEALLFSEGGTVTKKRLIQLLHCNNLELETALSELKGALTGHGISVLETDTDVSLVIASNSSEAIKQIRSKELDRDIGEAGLEVIAIIGYRGPSTRTEVDYIRGVNSGSTIRALVSRGLIDRTQNPSDSREYRYRLSSSVLAYLGVTRKEDFPDYAKISSELNAFEKGQGEVQPFERYGNTDNAGRTSADREHGGDTD